MDRQEDAFRTARSDDEGRGDGEEEEGETTGGGGGEEGGGDQGGVSS